MTKLSFKQKMLVGLTLFGMFFGAGNLIFPIHLGQLAGKNLFFAILGFVVTAVGIPILGVASIGSTHSDGLQSLADKVGKKYSYFFTTLLYLTIGPFFAIPRCATTSFTVGISPLLGDFSDNFWALLIFSLIFFAIVLFFSLRPAKITTWIGRIINPVFLVFLAILVFSAIFNPTANIGEVTPTDAYSTPLKAFTSSLIEGYGTLDAVAGLAFGIVVIDVIRRMGTKEDNLVAKDVLGSGILTGILMALIYILTIIIGAQSRGAFETSDNGGIALAQIANYYLGSVGSVILAITVTFACLKTSIGLVTSCSEAFVKMFKNKIPYKAWAIFFTIFSFVVSNFGLDTIIEYSLPVLMLIYPPAITLIVLALIGKIFEHDKIVYILTTIFTWIPAIFDFVKTLPFANNLQGMTDLGRIIFPMFDINLGWLLPALLGFAIGMIIHFVKKKTTPHLTEAKNA